MKVRFGRSITMALLTTASLLAASNAARAEEWIKFKNGHKLLVISSRIEGDVIYLKLKEGNEVGFPKELVEEAQATTDKRVFNEAPARTSGRGSGFNQLIGVQRALEEMGPAARLQAAAKVSADKTDTYGFSYNGSHDITKPTPGAGPSQARSLASVLNQTSAETDPDVAAKTDVSGKPLAGSRPMMSVDVDPADGKGAKK